MTLRLGMVPWLLVMAACIPVPTPSVVTLEEPPSAELARLAAGEAIVVLPNRERESQYVADCVREKLAEKLTQNRVLTADEVRDALFPWLEPNRTPRDDAMVQALVARPAVAQALQDLRLRYLVVVDLTSTDDTVGAEVLAAGGGFSKVSARATAEVVDLEAACCRPGGAASATGLQGYAHVMIYGFILLSAVEGPACDRLGAALVQSLEPPAVGRAAR
jgi:hypothetical protein